jgi:hypothetical protein
MFNYYDEFGYDVPFVDKKIDYIDTTDDNNPVCMILFDNTKGRRMSGQGSDFKTTIRNLVLDFANDNNRNTDNKNTDNKYRGNDVMHVNDYFYQTVEYSQILLNANSIDLLNKQDTRNYRMEGFILANLKMQTLRSVLYSGMSLLEIDRMLVVGGMVLYAYGVRAFNDIDAILTDIDPNDSSHVDAFVEKYFVDQSTKIYFLDAGVKKEIIDKWIMKDQKILDAIGILDFKERTLDPRYHFYFQGIKLVVLEYEMLRKLIRNRTVDHVDFVMINLLFPQIIQDYVTLKSIDDFGKPLTTNVTDNTDNTIESPYFIISDKYRQIAGPYNDNIPKNRMMLLKRRYADIQIKKAQSDPRFNIFFGSTFVKSFIPIKK